MNNNTTNQIAVFLDVDGVINSLNHLYEDDFHMSAPAKPYQAGKYRVWVPDYMGALIRAIYKSTDMYWLTTWRDKANKYISPILGIPSDIPVITDGLNTRNVRWKAAACRPTAERLNAQGKTVYWIEDFHGFRHHELLDVLTPIDTDAYGEAFCSHSICRGNSHYLSTTPATRGHPEWTSRIALTGTTP